MMPSWCNRSTRSNDLVKATEPKNQERNSLAIIDMYHRDEISVSEGLRGYGADNEQPSFYGVATHP